MAGTTNIVQQKNKGMRTKSKGLRLWLPNLVLFTCFVLLSLTGLIPWVFLPRGHGGELGALRHTLIELHEWVALVLIALVILHLVWHWSYITASAKRWLRPPIQEGDTG